MPPPRLARASRPSSSSWRMPSAVRRRAACRRTSRSRERTSRWPDRRLRRRRAPTALRSPTCNPLKSKSGSPTASGPCERCDASRPLPPPAHGRRAARATALWHERRRRGRPPLRPRHRSGILRRGTRTNSSGTRSTGCSPQLTPADQAMVAALPFGGVIVPFTSDTARMRLAAEPRDRPGVAQRDRIRSRLPHAPVPRIARRVAADPGHAACAADADCSSPPVSRRRGATRRWGCSRACASSSSICSATWPRRQARRAPTSTSCSRPTSGSARRSPRPTFGGAGDRGSDNPLEGIEHLAGVTGGTRLPLDATGTASLLRVARESSAYYVAELEPVRGEVFGRSRPLERAGRAPRRHRPRTSRDHVHGHDAAPATTRLTVTDILASTEAVTDLRLRVGGFTVRDADGKLRVGRPGGAGGRARRRSRRPAPS